MFKKIFLISILLFTPYISSAYDILNVSGTDETKCRSNVTTSCLLNVEEFIIGEPNYNDLRTAHKNFNNNCRKHYSSRSNQINLITDDIDSPEYCKQENYVFKIHPVRFKKHLPFNPPPFMFHQSKEFTLTLPVESHYIAYKMTRISDYDDATKKYDPASKSSQLLSIYDECKIKIKSLEQQSEILFAYCSNSALIEDPDLSVITDRNKAAISTILYVFTKSKPVQIKNSEKYKALIPQRTDHNGNYIKPTNNSKNEPEAEPSKYEDNINGLIKVHQGVSSFFGKLVK